MGKIILQKGGGGGVGFGSPWIRPIAGCSSIKAGVDPEFFQWGGGLMAHDHGNGEGAGGKAQKLFN